MRKASISAAPMSLGCRLLWKRSPELSRREDVALNPTDVGLFGTNRVMLESDRVTYPIEQLPGTFFHFSPRELLIFGTFSGILSVNLIPYDCTDFHRVWQVSYAECNSV